ncbi:MAG: hypothetical protein Q4G03_11485 [Planctomycetia bacterium]|nr:hypothetical protein [Planctomycetia bacterium]
MTLIADLWRYPGGLLQTLATLYAQSNATLLRNAYHAKDVNSPQQCDVIWMQLQERHSVVKNADAELLARQRVGILILPHRELTDAPRPLHDALILNQTTYQLQEVQPLCASGEILAYQIVCQCE